MTVWHQHLALRKMQQEANFEFCLAEMIIGRKTLLLHIVQCIVSSAVYDGLTYGEVGLTNCWMATMIVFTPAIIFLHAGSKMALLTSLGQTDVEWLLGEVWALLAQIHC